jgi:predicted nucleic acid-binding protein
VVAAPDRAGSLCLRGSLPERCATARRGTGHLASGCSWARELLDAPACDTEAERDLSKAQLLPTGLSNGRCARTARRGKTPALREELGRWGDGRFVTSALTAIELPRAVRRAAPAREGDGTLRAVAALLETVILVPIASEVIRRAASIKPATLRSLDPIHLASAMVAMPRGIAPVVCGYDDRLQGAARVHGLLAVSPV